MTQEFDEQGWRPVERALHQKRAHDVTMLIEGVDGRFALMSKHNYPPGIYRSPSGGVKPTENFLTGALREAKEETGLTIDLKRFLLHITLDIAFGQEVATWDSYVFHATTHDSELNPTDLREVRDTIWVGRGQMGAIIDKLKSTGNGGLMYRGDLTAESLWTLDNPLKIRESNPKDMKGIEQSLAANQLQGINMARTLWWVAEVNGMTSGTVGITAHEECVELTGLTVDPLFRGKGLGHAMVEFACDQWKDPAKRARFAQASKTFLNDKLWLTAQTPAYFLPVDFIMTDPKLVPKSIQATLTGPKARWAPMRFQLYKI